MENTHSVSTATAITPLLANQCTINFSEQIENALNSTPASAELFPIAMQMLRHFMQLPQPLLLLNAQYWQAATTMIERGVRQRPVQCLQNYDQATLFGRISIDESGQTCLQAGEIAKFDQGVLALHISPLLTSPDLWFLLKAFLLDQRLNVSAAVNGHKLRTQLPPQESHNQCKIILVANRFQLDELAQLDPDFAQVSSLFAEIAGDIKNSDENIHALHHFCQQLLLKNTLPPLSNDAYNLLFQYLARQCEHQQHLRFSPQLILDTLQHAHLIEQQETDNKGVITAQHLQAVLNLQQQAHSNAQHFSDQALLEGQLKIQLSGESIGQINGMSVVELMGYPTEFGEIFRVSASDMIGDGEIVDVERKVELAGNIHAKSTLIVQSYLNHFFTSTPNFPLSCNIVFEQSYQESDGDSASLAILLAATSCYAELPIQQNLFVTGALDQQGNVLAIGGVNQKIEAITRLFDLDLLDRPVTVLLPQANMINLLLSPATLALIEAKKINIYPLQHSLQAFPFAMSTPFEGVIEKINKRIHHLHKEEHDEPLSLMTKCLNLLR